MSALAAHIEAAIMGGAPGTSGNPVYVNLKGPSPYAIAILGVFAAIIGSVIAYALANHAQENRDRIQRLSATKGSYLDMESRLWAFSATAANTIEQLKRIMQTIDGEINYQLLTSFDASGMLLLAAGTGLDLRALQPLISDAYSLSEAMDTYKRNPDQYALAGLKMHARYAGDHLNNAQKTALDLRTKAQRELNTIETQIKARPRRW